jgi:hypothetical protein
VAGGICPTRAWLRLCGPPLTGSVCAVQAVMLGGESPRARYAWSRRTREAHGRHREVGSEGSVERRCGARDPNRIGGVVQPGRAGTQPRSPPSTRGRGLIPPAPRHSRDDRFPRETASGPRCGASRAAERRAGNPLATFRGSRRWVTASGDPVGEIVRLPPIPIMRQESRNECNCPSA